MKKIIEMRNIIKRYYIGMPNELEILHGIDLDVYDEDFISIVGASGSGKSTLMNIIGVLDRPTDGEYILNNLNINEATDGELSEIRNKNIGFVFQNFNLIPRISAVKNVELPMMYNNVPAKERRERAMDLLKLVEMDERANHNPNELSGGQKQRVSIARALANNPNIILADEPTGALDTRTGRVVMDLFHKLNEDQKRTIVLITHNIELANETKTILTMKDGRIER